MTEMKLGLGLYRTMLDKRHFQFARQCGCTHAIVHLANYYSNGDDSIVTATDEKNNYGKSITNDPIWEAESMIALQKEAQSEGITIFGIENFDPGDWYDVLLDGPKREKQIEKCKSIISNCGKAGIRSFGYNFSLAGVWGHQKRRAARGNAISTCFDSRLLDVTSPIPEGDVWNMTYAKHNGKTMATITEGELWDRLRRFLDDILPAAEEAGVEMALHPDDPPMPNLRSQPRLVDSPEKYQRVIDLNASPANKLEFCLGSLQEMEKGNIYESIEQYGRQKRISYIHFRNVKGKVPCYDEVFIDEGDIDMLRVLKQLDQLGFDGVLVPDHTPLLDCGAPWDAGMAFALGYMKAAFRVLDIE